MAQEENFVTRDVFNSEIRRIDEKVDNAVERMEMKMDLYTSRVDNMLIKMDGKIDTLNARVDGIVNFVGWTIALTSIIIAVGTFVIQMLLK